MSTLAELVLEFGSERHAALRDSKRARRLPATRPAKLILERQPGHPNRRYVMRHEADRSTPCNRVES